MSGVAADLTPSEVMTLRFEAQSSGDFELIYHTSHRLSTLRRSFPDLVAYRAYASEQLTDKIIVTGYELLVEQVKQSRAYVLCQVRLTVDGVQESFAEIAELRRSVVGWRFLHCSRLPLDLMPDNPNSVDMKQLASHPRAISF